MMQFIAAGFVAAPLRVGDRELHATQVVGTVPEVPFLITLEPGSERGEGAVVVDVLDDHTSTWTLERGHDEVEHPAGFAWAAFPPKRAKG